MKYMFLLISFFVTFLKLSNAYALANCNIYNFDHVIKNDENNTQITKIIDNKPLDKKHINNEVILCKGYNHVNTNKKIISLTFDDGPSKQYTEQILLLLRNNNIKSTFFFVGKNVKDYPEIVTMLYKNGHVIANHTHNHSRLSDLSEDEIKNQIVKCNLEIKKIIGVSPLLFRPPYGSCSINSINVVRNLNLHTIMWSAMVDDYRIQGNSAEKIAHGILNLVKPGSIIGMHDGGGKRDNTVAALKIIIPTLKNQGYKFVTIPELLNISAYQISD